MNNVWCVFHNTEWDGNILVAIFTKEIDAEEHATKVSQFSENDYWVEEWSVINPT